MRKSPLVEPVFTHNAVWERASLTEYHGITTCGKVLVIKTVTPLGYVGWMFLNSFGDIITKIHAPNFRDCRLVQALEYFDKKYLVN